MSAGASADKFPWEQLMQTGMGMLAIAPNVFWSMTPKELTAAINAIAGESATQTISRSDLDGLLARFPDEV